MSYFEQFQKLVYDIKGNEEYKLVPDIFRRIKLKSKVSDNLMLYDKYDIADGETPESVAFNVYGDAQLHWVILLTNNIQNRYHGWPLSNQAFEKWVFEKYENPQATRHYEVIQSSGPQKGNGPEDYDHMLEVNDGTPGAQSVSYYEYELRIQNQKRQIKLLDPRYLNAFVSEFERLIRK